MNRLPWESVMEDGVAMLLKSKAIRMRSPATVLLGKERDKELADPEAAFATVCTEVVAACASWKTARLTARKRIREPKLPICFLSIRTIESPPTSPPPRRRARGNSKVAQSSGADFW